MKKWAILMAVALLIGAVSVVRAEPSVIHVYVGESIQDAVDSVSDGDIIYVHEGNYDEQVIIDGVDTALIAVGNVIIAPLSCTGHGDVIQIYDAMATIDGFEVDASGCTSGIYARGCSWLSEEEVDVTVKDNDVYGYFKNGITVNCDLATGKVVNNTVTGSDPSVSVAQNGIQFGYGAKGVIMRNNVDSHWYEGANWAASGILVFEADEVTVQQNTVKNSQTGIAVETWCWYEPSASNNRVVVNTIEDSEWGISVAAIDLYGYSGCDATANNNKVVNNEIVNTNSGDTGITIWAGDDWYSDGNVYSPSADNNKVIRNQIDGFATTIDEAGTASKVHANVF